MSELRFTQTFGYIKGLTMFPISSRIPEEMPGPTPVVKFKVTRPTCQFSPDRMPEEMPMSYCVDKKEKKKALRKKMKKEKKLEKEKNSLPEHSLEKQHFKLKNCKCYHLPKNNFLDGGKSDRCDIGNREEDCRNKERMTKEIQNLKVAYVLHFKTNTCNCYQSNGYCIFKKHPKFIEMYPPHLQEEIKSE